MVTYFSLLVKTVCIFILRLSISELVAKVLGVSISSAYELMHEEVFPSVRIGSRFVVPKDKFQQWVERQIGGAE